MGLDESLSDFAEFEINDLIGSVRYVEDQR
jgi:hypothetical protein